MNSIGKMIFSLGIGLVILGLVIMLGERFGLGKLPGDIFIRKGNFTFAFPIVSCIIVSLLLTLILNLLRR
jgi:hypothetical protein